MESYYRKTARRMRTIEAPPSHSKDWRELSRVYERINADARRARFERNEQGAGAGSRFLERYDVHSGRALDLRGRLDLPMECGRD
jgi:hypothetical protein